MNPLISIVIPTFNRVTVLPNAIDSVFKQTYPNWELIIVDDGSRDSTSKYLKTITDNRVKIIQQKNAGLASSRNNGMHSAKGEWIAYLDDDNELYPNYLEAVASEIESHSNILFALPKSKRTIEFYKNGKLIEFFDDSADFPDKVTTKDIFLRRFHCDENGFIHSRKIVEEGFEWDDKSGGLVGWEFFMQIAKVYPDKFLYIPETLLTYHMRYGSDGMTSKRSYIGWSENFKYVYHKHKDSSLMKNQTWYPQRVLFYSGLQRDYETGKAPDPQIRYFHYLKNNIYDKSKKG